MVKSSCLDSTALLITVAQSNPPPLQLHAKMIVATKERTLETHLPLSTFDP